MYEKIFLVSPFPPLRGERDLVSRIEPTLGTNSKKKIVPPEWV